MYTVIVGCRNVEAPLARLTRVKAGQTLLELFLASGFSIRHDCGGVCHCTTCRIEVKKGEEHIEPRSSRERDFLAKAGGGPQTRLACQCVLLAGKGTVELLVPQP